MSSEQVFGKLFLGVGAMKAGTTWLYSLLSRHPELQFSLEKELHYFYDRYVWPSSPARLRRSRYLCKANRMQRARNIYLPRAEAARGGPDVIQAKRDAVDHYLTGPVDDSWYRQLFQGRPLDAYACDFSNLSALLKAGHWRRIAGKCTQLRVMYTMRDPVERYWSHAKFHLEYSGQRELIDTWGVREYGKLLRRSDLRAHSDYGRVVRTLRAALPDEALHFMFYEDIHADRLGHLRAIENFLGIAPFDYPDTALKRRRVASLKRPMPDFFPDLVAKEADRIKSDLQAQGLTPPEIWR